MKSRLIGKSIVAVLLVVITSCAYLQRESPEKKIRAFMTTFEESLTQSDQEILKFFDSQQSPESILAAIKILQNVDAELVQSSSDFSGMQITVEETDRSIKNMLQAPGVVANVLVPVTIQASEGGSKTIDLIFRIKEEKNSFIIYQLHGEDLYNSFTSLKNEIQFAAHEAEEIKNREGIYALADSLREKYDYLAWYAEYNDEIFFYVVNGEWSEENVIYKQNTGSNYKMGLINSSGKEIIPVAFDLIGILGAEKENTVEVKSNEGYGYFSLAGDTLVPAIYNQVIPMVNSDYWVVENEGEYGWIDTKRNYQAGFPNKDVAEEIKSFKFLPSGITINEHSYALCEPADKDHAGYGIFISPSYWVAAGLIEPIRSGITTTITNAPIGGWTEYIELGETMFQSISNKIGIVITSFKERYLEGREEFYEHKKILFKDSLLNTVLTEDYSNDEIEIKQIIEGVVEIKSIQGFSNDYFEGMPMEDELQGLNYYRYFSVDENGGVSVMTSNRSHPETEFAKLDDSYITGSFRVFHMEGEQWENLSELPLGVLTHMRNEILAEYGMTFQDPELRDTFSRHKWYSPRFNTEAEFKDQLNEYDAYNLNFLAKVIRKKRQQSA